MALSLAAMQPLRGLCRAAARRPIPAARCGAPLVADGRRCSGAGLGADVRPREQDLAWAERKVRRELLPDGLAEKREQLRRARNARDGEARSAFSGSKEQIGATARIRQLGRDRNWEEALQVFYSVRDPDHFLQVATMDVCAKALQVEQANRLFESLPRKSTTAFNVMIAMSGRLRRVHEAVRLFQDMRQQVVAPTEMTYTCLISAYSMVPDVAAAMRLLAEMRSLGLPVNIVTYGALLSTCGKAGDTEQAERLLAEMEAAGMEADVVHWCSLLLSCVARKDSGKAQAIFDEMRSRGVRPNVVAYTTLCKCFGGPDALSKAESVFRSMQLEGVTPDTHAYDALLQIALDARAAGRIKDLVAEMDQRGFPRSRITELRLADADALQHVLGEGTLPLPFGWCERVDPTSGQPYYWMEADPGGTTTWVRPT